MFHRRNNRKHIVTPHMESEMNKVEYQQKIAEIGLQDAKTLAEQLKEIREANHFTQGFRRTLGIQDGN